MKRARFRVALTATICSCLLMLVNVSEAATLPVSATDHGHYRGDGVHFRSTPNYAAGNDAGERDFRSFFVFDLAPVVGQIVTAASLEIYLPATGYSSSDPSETFALFDMSAGSITSAVGEIGTDTNLGVFSDLGTGDMYGSTAISVSMQDSVISIELNAAGVGDINAAVGSLFGIGGLLTTASVAPVQEIVFVNTQTILPGETLLILETTPVPLPPAAALLATGLLGTLRLGRRRRALP